MNQARSFQALRSLQHALTDDINTFRYVERSPFVATNVSLIPGTPSDENVSNKTNTNSVGTMN